MNTNVKLDKEKYMRTAEIYALSHDGRGIATIDRKTTFVAGALPGETVTCKILQKHSHYNDATTIEILQKSDDREIPACAHFGVCGGCSLQYMSGSAQLKLKEQTLLEQLQHFGKVQPARVIPPLFSRDYGYRRKARLGVKYVIKKNKLMIGFREKSSRYLADIESCAVLHPAVSEQFKALSECIASLNLYQYIPQIEVAIGDSDVALVIRHMQPLPIEDKQKLIDFAKTHLYQLYLQPNSPAPVTKLWPEDGFERLRYTLPDHALEFLFHPLDFTQINLEMNRSMIHQALHFLELTSQDNVLDLFCGIGNFSLSMARYCAKVVGVEGSMEMVERAKDNAVHNQLQNTEFYTTDLFKPESTATWLQRPYDKILLDPPRVGAKEILPHLAGVNAKKILYVSCNPATLARDAGALVHQYGYHLSHAGIMNMFPQTAHIEAMAIFDKN